MGNYSTLKPGGAGDEGATLAGSNTFTGATNTFNNNVVLGSSSADSVTINGTIASAGIDFGTNVLTDTEVGYIPSGGNDGEVWTSQGSGGGAWEAAGAGGGDDNDDIDGVVDVSASNVSTFTSSSEASTSQRGTVSTGTQSFAGAKTFTGDATFNEDVTLGSSSADAIDVNGTISSGGIDMGTNTLTNAMVGYIPTAGSASNNNMVWTSDGSGAGGWEAVDPGNDFTGDVNISAGDVVLDSGRGIDFSATAGTGTSELLDDYEEGTWTPATTDTDVVLTIDNATYTKVGNMVTIHAHIDTSSSESGDFVIASSSLPFTPVSGSIWGTWHEVWDDGIDQAGPISSPATNIYFISNASSIPSELTIANVVSLNDGIIFGLSYRTTA